MCNLFNHYLLVLFHLLKVFVSDVFVSFLFSLYTSAPHTFSPLVLKTSKHQRNHLKQTSVELMGVGVGGGRVAHKEMQCQEQVIFVFL